MESNHEEKQRIFDVLHKQKTLLERVGHRLILPDEGPCQECSSALWQVAFERSQGAFLTRCFCTAMNMAVEIDMCMCDGNPLYLRKF